jgi:hypothetical protein
MYVDKCRAIPISLSMKMHTVTTGANPADRYIYKYNTGVVCMYIVGYNVFLVEGFFLFFRNAQCRLLIRQKSFKRWCCKLSIVEKREKGNGGGNYRSSIGLTPEASS